MDIKTKWLKSFIYGCLFGFVLSLLYASLFYIAGHMQTLFLGGLLYNSLGFVVFTLPGTLMIITNMYGHAILPLVYFVFFIINILYYGFIGIIISIFLKEINKKIFSLLAIVFILFFASSLLYLTCLSQIGRGTPISSNPLGDPKQECLKEGGQWTFCENIYNNHTDIEICKSLSKLSSKKESYGKYPGYGCDCGSNRYWSGSYNTCWKPGSGKILDQLTIMEIGIIFNLVLLLFLSAVIGCLGNILKKNKQ